MAITASRAKASRSIVRARRLDGCWPNRQLVIIAARHHY
jgi:hypothetical protein